jgi:hypothetical protein
VGVVTGAALQDRAGARLVFRRLGGVGKKLRVLWVAGASRGPRLAWGLAHGQFLLRPVLRTATQKGVVVFPKRGIRRADLGLAQSLSSAEQRRRSAAGEPPSNDLQRHDSLDAQTAYRCLTFSDSL